MTRMLFWLLAAVTLAVYLTMVLWSLPYIAAEAGGLTPFDMRPTGYSFEDALAFLTALSDAGYAFYRGVQHRLDIVFPALLAATLYIAIVALLPARLGHSRWILPLPVLATAVFDWAENAAVAGMLTAGAGGVTPEMVAAASRWSMLKAGVSTLAYFALLALLVWRGIVWLRRRQARA